MTALIAFVLTFVLAYTGMHYTLSSWGVRSPITIVAGVIFGVIAAFLATLAVAASFPL